MKHLGREPAGEGVLLDDVEAAQQGHAPSFGCDQAGLGQPGMRQGHTTVPGQYAGRVKVVKVNVDDNPRTSARFDAQSIPTLVILRGGTTVTRLVRAQPEPVLRKRIDAVLAA